MKNNKMLLNFIFGKSRFILQVSSSASNPMLGTNKAEKSKSESLRKKPAEKPETELTICYLKKPAKFGAFVICQARNRPQIEVFEIREDNNRGAGLTLKQLNTETDLIKILFPNRKNEARVYPYIDSSSNENDYDGGTKVIILSGSSLLENNWNEKSRPNEVFVDKTRSLDGADYAAQNMYHRIPLSRNQLERNQHRLLRSHNVNDRTAAPRHKYYYDSE